MDTRTAVSNTYSLVEAHVAEVAEALDPGGHVRTDLELVGDGGIGERSRERPRLGDEVERLAADRDQAGRREVSDRRHVVGDTNARVLERV